MGREGPGVASGVKREKTAEDIAQVYSVNEQTVRRWVKDGGPASRRDGKLWFNEDQVNRWVHETGRRTTPGRPPKPKEPVPPELEGDKDYWLARKYRNQCMREEGKLVDVADVERWLSGMAAVVGQKLTNLPAAVVPRLQGQEPAEQEVILREAIDDARRSIATELPRFGG
jgi:phage terminase Nu1 subunit (DNA packaging protein)